MASKPVSLDEYLHSKGAYGVERKTFAKDDGVILKGMPSSEIKRVKYDEEKGAASFVMSAEVEDRDRDIVIQAGLDTSNFEANPVALFSHNSNFMIGKWSALSKNLTGRPKRTEGTLNLSLGVPKADEAAILLKSDTLRACSIGFLPKEIERREVPDEQRGDFYYPGYMIHSAELFECSVCAVPANPMALAKATLDGERWALEDLERVLDGWSKQHGLLIPRKAFEDAHRGSGGDRKSFVMGGERFVAWKDAAGEPHLEKASSIAKGDFVSWSANGATARGKVTKIVSDGTIEVPGATVAGTTDDPAAKITIYTQDGDGWTATDTKVAHKCSALTKIDALKAAAMEPTGLAESITAKLLAALGIKGKTEAADPKPGEGGQKPAPEPTPEQKLRQQFADDLPALEARHLMIEADARMADLDATMGQHVPA
ncbi:HK97 family phage prohead protease [Methylobacterium longum]|uniref:HK97 family phage prohead protease n=1 Tax=Methylobacterium longum TaxID=767694 RepID=A0ABT8APQ8_9HYPH|nr:HVA1 family protein [Methylobacterium longum]MDN3571818.1 HK97 family phage prohead protease [Methylobacterium longum]GJE14019.1 hypothetical protein FOHLNKBM_5088 [Methylobacterium longum]